MIRIRGLEKDFGGRPVLRGIDLAAAPGERLALLGLNGAGKTTLLRCVLGLVPYRGRILIGGTDVVRDGRGARARIGYVPQRAPHFEGTLREVVEFYGRLRGIEREEVAARLEALDLSLEEHGGKPVRALSGGMLQKTLLGLALAARVPVLLLDEPTANLDPRARRDFLRSLGRVDPSTTVLLASHRLGDVEAICDRLLVLHEGRIAFEGRLEELWRRVGADVTLWLRVPEERSDSLRRLLEGDRRVHGVVRNGAGVGLRVSREDRADVLAGVREEGIPVLDFWTETPTLEELMDGLLGRSQPGGGVPGEAGGGGEP